MTKERLDISLFRLTNGVSLGHTCCSFFHVGKVSMSPSYGSIGIGMSRIVSTWNVHHWLHYCFHISQQFIVSKETGTTESLPLSHISVIPHFLFIKPFFYNSTRGTPVRGQTAWRLTAPSLTIKSWHALDGSSAGLLWLGTLVNQVQDRAFSSSFSQHNNSSRTGLDPEVPLMHASIELLLSMK